MTGSGTLLDPYVIWDIADLQSLRTRDAAYYKLGGDIDASATPGWFGGMGFEPVDWPFPQRRYPTGDFSSAGPWTVFPLAPATMFDKVNEVDPDLDASYIRFEAGGVAATVLFTAPNFNIPAGSTISKLQMTLVMRDEGGPGANNWWGYVRVGGVDYQSPNMGAGADGVTYHVDSIVARGFTKNPATGLAWTIDDINGVGPNPLEAWGFRVSGTRIFRFTQVYAKVHLSNCPVQYTFDGDGHKISDLFIDRRTDTLYCHASTDIALFRDTVSSYIKNLTLENITVKGFTDVAGLIGYAHGSNLKLENITISGNLLSTLSDAGGLIGYAYVDGLEINNASFNGQLQANSDGGGIVGYLVNHTATPSTIQNCNFNGVLTVGRWSGGIVGEAYRCDLLSCTAVGTINGSTDSGGIIGYADSCNVHDSESSATLNCGAADFVGGLIGYIQPSASLVESVLRCKSTGNVNANGYGIGGLIGSADNEIDVGQSFATGDTVGDNTVGGLIGYSNARVRNSYALGGVTGPGGNVGGLVGDHDSPFDIENSYSAGLPQGGAPIGGLIGNDSGSGGLVVSCFWDVETSGQTTSDGGAGKTTAEMKTLNTFLDAGWGIEARATDKNNGYPYLAWQSVWYIFVLPPPPAISVVTLPATEVR